MELSMTTKIKANLQSFQNAETFTNRFSTASYRCRMNRVRKGKSNQGFDMTDAPRSGPVNFTWQNSAESRWSRETHDIYMALSGVVISKAECVYKRPRRFGKVLTVLQMSRLKTCICKGCKRSLLKDCFYSCRITQDTMQDILHAYYTSYEGEIFHNSRPCTLDTWWYCFCYFPGILYSIALSLVVPPGWSPCS